MLLSSAIDAAICRSLFYLYMRMFAYTSSKYVYKCFVVYVNIDNYRYKYILPLKAMNICINKPYLLSFIASIYLSAYRYVSIYISIIPIDINTFYQRYN